MGGESRRVNGDLCLYVVVPFLNERDCLGTFLESMAGQTRLPDRIILVDDGSTDGSGELAHRFAAEDAAFTVLHRPPRLPLETGSRKRTSSKAFQWAVEQLDSGLGRGGEDGRRPGALPRPRSRPSSRRWSPTPGSAWRASG